MDENSIYTLASKIQIMKPNKVKEGDTRGAIKLEAILDSSEYAAEEKIDGCHYFMIAWYFFSQDHIEKTNNYPHLQKCFKDLNMSNLILDGEINYPGKTSQYCTHVTGALASSAVEFQNTNGPIHYSFWDMLRTPKGTWLIKEPYKNRRKLCEYFYANYIKGTIYEPYIHLTSINYDAKRDFKDGILARGGEGIVLKKLNSLYVMGKKPAWQWMKIKQSDEEDFVIMGFEPANKATTTTAFDNWPYWVEENGISVPVSKFYFKGWIGSIQLGAYVDGILTQVCTASGISEELRQDISEHQDTFINRVVKTGFMEVTEAGIPRHPKILEIHPDKRPEECTWNFAKRADGDK
jgi:ATP-dependent DNA ligase